MKGEGGVNEDGKSLFKSLLLCVDTGPKHEIFVIDSDCTWLSTCPDFRQQNLECAHFIDKETDTLRLSLSRVK